MRAGRNLIKTGVVRTGRLVKGMLRGRTYYASFNPRMTKQEHDDLICLGFWIEKSLTGTGLTCYYMLPSTFKHNWDIAKFYGAG